MYTSESLSLAVLELLVHVDVEDVPVGYRAIAAEIPTTVTIERVEVADLPREWRRTPAPKALRKLGDRWLSTGGSAVLAVPSAVVEGEWNYLLDPTHADFGKIRIRAPRPFRFDSRLFIRQ